MKSTHVITAIAGLLMAASAFAERVGDLTDVAGVRSNQLIGYGLIVGLDDTGGQTSQTPFTTQSLKNMLQQFGKIGRASCRERVCQLVELLGVGGTVKKKKK